MLGDEDPPLSGSTPVARMFALLELIASKGDYVSLQMLARETGLPKATLHRMLMQFVSEGLLVRQTDKRLYAPGPRLRGLAEDLLMNATQFGARHTALRALVEELSETCNITTLTGSDVLYLDREETTEPLRFHLRPGSRVPIHCSASGKLLVGQLPEAARRKLLSHAPLEQFTDSTITQFSDLEEEVLRCREQGYAIDNQEYIHGLVCFAVLVPSSRGRSSQCVAVQGPSLRLSPDDADRVLPALRRTAEILRRIEDESREASYGSGTS
jgi:IclR family transcriptional regulator, acetate operon repressor